MKNIFIFKKFWKKSLKNGDWRVELGTDLKMPEIAAHGGVWTTCAPYVSGPCTQMQKEANSVSPFESSRLAGFLQPGFTTSILKYD